MKPLNLENHWFPLGKTYILQNRRVLKLVEKVAEKVIKNDATIHLKTVKNQYKIDMPKNIGKVWTKYRKRSKMGARSGHEINKML